MTIRLDSDEVDALGVLARKDHRGLRNPVAYSFGGSLRAKRSWKQIDVRGAALQRRAKRCSHRLTSRRPGGNAPWNTEMEEE